MVIDGLEQHDGPAVPRGSGLTSSSEFPDRQSPAFHKYGRTPRAYLELREIVRFEYGGHNLESACD